MEFVRLDERIYLMNLSFSDIMPERMRLLSVLAGRNFPDALKVMVR